MIPLDIASLEAAYAAGATTPQAVLDAVFDRIAALGERPVWICLVPRARVAARLAENERRRAAGEGLPLYGIPFAVKDNIDVAGLPTMAACPDFTYVPARSATVVETLEAAGAILVGKTNLDQFATGLVGFALGTGFDDTVGLEPTKGSVSARGMVPACRSQDCVAIVAASSGEASRVLVVAQGLAAEGAAEYRIAVIGAHLSGQPLNHQLTSRNAKLLGAARTAPGYSLYLLPGTVPAKPGLVRDGQGSGRLDIEIWALDAAGFSSFVAEIPAPLGLGTIALDDGGAVQGFLCEAHAVVGAEDITRHGGWRGWLAQKTA